MKKALNTLVLLILTFSAFAQTPEAFKYQSIIRNGSGELVVNQNVGIQLSILEGSESGISVYTETWNVQTNQFGLISLNVGKGITTDDFSAVSWGTNSYYLQVAVDLSGGTSYTVMGASQLLSVPYALYSNESGNGTSQWLNNESAIYYNGGNVGVGTSTPSGKLVIKADPGAASDSTLFEVKDKDGIPLMRITSEGVKIYVKDGTKGYAGGFAVGRYATAKGGIDTTFLLVTPDSTRVYTSPGAKGGAGGFAVGRYATAKGGSANKYFYTGIDSTRIYLNENPKGIAGGFAVGRYATAKGDGVDYFNINPSTDPDTINPSEPRILWYPLKEAFLTGRVLIESPDSVGQNSMATGFESKSIGNFSQALGFKARAFGNNSTAIGNNSNSNAENSYAIGNGARSSDINSYALGNNALASGISSFAIGTQAIAEGDYSLAFGDSSISNNKYSTALGYKTLSSGYYSTAIGNKTISSGSASIAMGFGAIARGNGSTAMGRSTEANASYSTAMGMYSKANGYMSMVQGQMARTEGTHSIAMGENLIARSYKETVFGTNNDTTSTLYCQWNWFDEDPLFVIGNGDNWYTRHNAVTVLKNGKFGINTNSPDKLLTVDGDARITGDIIYGSLTPAKRIKHEFVFEPEYKKDFKISEVENFIKINKHLPWVTSVKDEKEGINMTRLSFETLEAIENQQLQIIELNKQLIEKDKIIKELKQEITKTNDRLKVIEEIITPNK